MRKFFFTFCSLLVLSVAIVLTKNQWLVLGAKYALNKKFPDAVVYKQVKSQEGKVCVELLHIHQANADLTFNNLEFSLQVGKLLKHPHTLFQLYRKGFSHWIEFISLLREYGGELEVEQGILQLEDFRYYFQLKKGKKRHELATLSIANDPASLAHPYIVIQFTEQQDHIVAQLSVDQVATAKFFQLASFAFPQLLQDFTNPNGSVQLHGTLTFNRQGQLEEYGARLSCEDLEIHHPKLQMACQFHHLAGSVNFPVGINHEGFPLWKKIQCGLLMEEGNVILGGALALTNLKGTLVLDPQQDPAMDITGELVGEDTPLSLHLGGKGALHDDKAYWLEFILGLQDQQGTDCGATFSLCSPQTDTLVLQLEAQNLLPTQVQMLKQYFVKKNQPFHEWEIQKGVFGGKLIAVINKGTLSQFEVEDFVAENVTLAHGSKSHHFERITAEGSPLKDIDVTLSLSAPGFFGFFSDEWQEVYGAYRPHDRAQVAVRLHQGQNNLHTSAHVEFLQTEQSLQFGFTSPTYFPSSFQHISEGWLRAEKLSHVLYGPFIRLFNEDLQIYGTLDLVAAFDGHKVEASLQAGEFLSKHPFLDIKAPMIGERQSAATRAKLTYDIATHKCEGFVPLRKARVYDRQYGLHFKDVDADLHFSSHTFTAQVKQSHLVFDGMKLLNEAKFTLNYNDKLSLSNLNARLALDTDRSFFLTAPYVDEKVCQLHLFDGTQELASFKGSKENQWTGALKLSTMKDPFAIVFQWDPLENSATLQADQMGWHLVCAKSKDDFIIESLAQGQLILKASFAKKENDYLLSHFELAHPDYIFQAQGNFSITLPQSHAPLALQGELVADAHLLAPIECYTKAKNPFKFAYSPQLGLVLSHLDFAGEGGTVAVNHLEWHQKTNKTFFNQCSFNIAQELLEAFIGAKALPALLQDFQIFSTLNGQGGGVLEEGTLRLQGQLKAEEKDLGFSVEWKRPSAKLTLSDPAKDQHLHFQTSLHNKEFTLEAIKGTLCGLTADMKKGKGASLKGTLSIDISQFGSLLTPTVVNAFPLMGWKGQYQLEGTFIPHEHFEHWQFKGKMKGQGLKWHELKLGAVDAKLDIEPGAITIEALDISDEGGKVWIGEGILRRGSDGQWSYSFPLVEVRNFQPGVLYAEKVATPFIIKTANLKEVRGRLNDLTTLSAEGSLKFSNFSKKGEKFIPKNFPVLALHRLGFDPQLLCPVGGEINFLLQNGRLLVRSVDSLFGERHRFEWQMARGSSAVIDFDGQMAFDIQVKQFSGRSSTTPFTLSIRGSWDNPQISVR